MQPFFARDRRGSATKWFAYAAAAIVVTAAVGAHGLAWIAQSGRVPTIAFLPLNQRTLQAQAGSAVDMDATGAIRTPTRQP